MPFNRRQCLLGFGSLLSPAAFAASRSAQPQLTGPGSYGPKRYTSRTAPDKASRALLARPLPSPWQGAPLGGAVGTQLTRNFARIVAQNFAAQSPRQVAFWLDRADATDLMRLGQLYCNSRAVNGEPSSALDVLAMRVDAPRLARLSPAFGFDTMAEAVHRSAPERYSDFALLAPKVGGPVPFGRHVNDVGGLGSSRRASPSSIYLDMTIEEIYLSFRTTPFVGMSVPASIFSTMSTVGGPLALAWGAGQLVGNALTWGAQRFAPDLWNVIVDGLGGWLYDLERLMREPPQTDPIRSPEEATGSLLRLGYLERTRLPFEYDYYDFYAIPGGEFFETGSWASGVPYSPRPAGSCEAGSGCQEFPTFD